MRVKGLRGIWKGTMLRGTAFSGSYRKLRMLYSLEDPWDMASDREQHRFARINEMLSDVAPRFDRVLELGCGEGHQSVHLAALAGELHGVDISQQAVERARSRCPQGTFSVANLEEVPGLFAGKKFDLVTACEVLYYVPDCVQALAALQEIGDRIFVSNYLPRAEVIRNHFTGPGWSRLDDIVQDGTVWECALWQRHAP